MTIERIHQDPDGSVTDLFVQYRHFYGQRDDDAAARTFFQERLAAGDSLVWVARTDGRTDGFAQVYVDHSSLRLATDWTLNDLFVAPHARRTGAGRALVQRVLDDATADGVGLVRLETQHDNHKARALYDDLGFTVRPSEPGDGGFVTYERRVGHVA